MINLTDDVLRGKAAGDRTDLQTARKPFMYVHTEPIIKCMHVEAFLHARTVCIETDSPSLCGGVKGG